MTKLSDLCNDNDNDNDKDNDKEKQKLVYVRICSKGGCVITLSGQLLLHCFVEFSVF